MIFQSGSQVSRLSDAKIWSVYYHKHRISGIMMFRFLLLVKTMVFALAFHSHSSFLQRNGRRSMSDRMLSLHMSTGGAEFDYDVVIIGCGVGGHGAALHAKAQGLRTAVLTGKDIGGTCVNRYALLST